MRCARWMCASKSSAIAVPEAVCGRASQKAKSSDAIDWMVSLDDARRGLLAGGRDGHRLGNWGWRWAYRRAGWLGAHEHGERGDLLLTIVGNRVCGEVHAAVQTRNGHQDSE